VFLVSLIAVKAMDSPQLLHMIIYYSTKGTWLILIHWIRVMLSGDNFNS